ncbi:hypothetical protein ZIOFF_052756 [Zingiber officinale]|uniref:Anther-specific protein BCP1 n=1 Tax=Zingiber officinale TaxID=94328 RepID=A0A8J5FP92_ZINOF|nr:hypothetical protein ZIOFF_052756 [Zingiber officinale]
MARPQALIIGLILVAIVVSASADSPNSPTSSNDTDSVPNVLTPIAKSPLPADGPTSDDVTDSDAGGVGAPLGTTATQPESDSIPQSGGGAIPKSGAGALLNGGASTAMAIATSVSIVGYFAI